MSGQRSKSATAAAQVKQGTLSYSEAQDTLQLRKLEADVVSQEELVRDQTNLVDLRRSWGLVILGILLATIISDFILISLVGSGTWTFKDNGYFLDIVITEHLVQIFGLVLIVLKSLFPGGGK